MDNVFSQQEKEAINFLVNDYNQCFQQMRYYDNQIMDILKFIFTMFCGTITIALTLYQIGMKTELNLIVPGMAILIVGLIVGLFMLMIVIRNRVYFVQVTRYINEQRNLFFGIKPLGFSNRSKIYTDPTKPDFYDWKSSQLWSARTIAFFNSVLIGVLVYLCTLSWKNAIVSLIILLIFELLLSKSYLKTREGKSAEHAVFGKEKSINNS